MSANQARVLTETGTLPLAISETSVDIPLGQNTPQPAVVTTFHATGTSQLDGAVSGAGFTAAVEAIAGGAQTLVTKQNFGAPLPADLISVVNAVTPTDVALTLVQPAQARKLRYNIVIGTSPTTAITAGNLAVVGFDQDGNPITENVSLITTVNKTVLSAHAWSQITSATVSGYVASGGGTGNTIGIGVSNDFGIATGPGTVSNFALVKASKITRTVTGSGVSVTVWTNVVADDDAATATVDATARTVAPTTAPNANGLIDYEFTAAYNLAA